MKKIVMLCLLLTAGYSVFAQKTTPEIKEGSSFISTVYIQGQEIPVLLSIQKAKPFSLAWAVEGYGEGVFEMSENAIAKGTRMAMPSQPATGITKFADDETFGVISKAAFKSLVETKEFSVNGLKFKLKPTPAAFKISGKEVDVFNVANAESKIELWVLNNANYPMVMQTAGMPVDIIVHEIK